MLLCKLVGVNDPDRCLRSQVLHDKASESGWAYCLNEPRHRILYSIIRSAHCN